MDHKFDITAHVNPEDQMMARSVETIVELLRDQVDGGDPSRKTR